VFFLRIWIIFLGFNIDSAFIKEFHPRMPPRVSFSCRLLKSHIALLAFISGISVSGLCSASSLQILSPSPGVVLQSQKLDVEFSYDPSVFGQSPPVDLKIDGLDATATRGMRVKGTSPQTHETSASPSVSETKTVQIPARDCEIEVVLTALDGSTHSATVRVKWSGQISIQKKVGRLFVLSIGVSEYQDSSISKLQLAAKDAKDFVALASAQEGGFYTKVESRALLNDQATRDSLYDALEWIREAMREDDTAMIFLAGHGINDGGQFFFVPHDADDEKIRRTCFPFSELQDTATGLVGRAIVFLDACHSGGVGGGPVSNAISSLLAGWQQAKSNKGAVIFASSTGDQLSQEKLEWMNGAFTKALLEGLKGEAHPAKAGPISIALLESYVSRRVKELTSNQQTPTTTRSSDMSDFDFALAGDARSEKQRLEEDAFVKEAEKRAIEAVRDAFIAQQILIRRAAQIKDLEDVNSDGLFDEKISSYRQEVTVKQAVLSKSIVTLNELATRNSILVGKALSMREAELSETLKTANKEAADTAVAAMSSLKQQIQLPTSY
jgi:uncharacterized caspase-like protein